MFDLEKEVQNYVAHEKVENIKHYGITPNCEGLEVFRQLFCLREDEIVSGANKQTKKSAM